MIYLIGLILFFMWTVYIFVKYPDPLYDKSTLRLYSEKDREEWSWSDRLFHDDRSEYLLFGSIVAFLWPLAIPGVLLFFAAKYVAQYIRDNS